MLIGCFDVVEYYKIHDQKLKRDKFRLSYINLDFNCQDSWLLEQFHQGSTGTSNFRVKTDCFSKIYILQFSKDLRSLMAFVAKKKDLEAILSDKVWCDSVSHFPAFPVQQWMERSSSENGSSSTEEPKKRKYSWSVMNWIQWRVQKQIWL